MPFFKRHKFYVLALTALVVGTATIGLFQNCAQGIPTGSSTDQNVIQEVAVTKTSKAAGSQTTFDDVPETDPSFTFIESLWRNRVTLGCAANKLTHRLYYCPDDPITRGDLARFLVIAKYGPGTSLPEATGTIFPNDVPVDSPIARFIEKLYALGVTMGCAPGGFCPNDPVSREMLAYLLIATKEVSEDETGRYEPLPAKGIFVDVKTDDGYAPWVEELYRRQITEGCGLGKDNKPIFCPKAFATRAEAAKLLVNTFELK